MVEVDEKSLNCPDSFDRDVERNRDDVLECDEGEERGDETVELDIVVALVITIKPVRTLGIVMSLELGIDNPKGNGHDSKDKEIDEPESSV